MTKDLNYLDDGISCVNRFLTSEEIRTLNNELDYLFSKKSINGSLGTITLNKNTSHLMMPTLSVRSLNLLELSLKVKKEFEKNSQDFSSYVNTQIEIIQESRNPSILGWHTDNRPGMVRAILYLDVDKEKSGMFRYMKKSHKRDFHVDHYINKQQIETYTPSIVTCDVPEGTLILFDTLGFHGREKCLGRRRVLMFEFQPPNTNYTKSAVPLSSRNLTKNVLNNIFVFINGATEYNHGGDKFYRNPPSSNLIQKISRKFNRNS
jgi:hypothetical protein